MELAEGGKGEMQGKFNSIATMLQLMNLTHPPPQFTSSTFNVVKIRCLHKTYVSQGIVIKFQQQQNEVR